MTQQKNVNLIGVFLYLLFVIYFKLQPLVNAYLNANNLLANVLFSE